MKEKPLEKTKNLKETEFFLKKGFTKQFFFSIFKKDEENDLKTKKCKNFLKKGLRNGFSFLSLKKKTTLTKPCMAQE